MESLELKTTPPEREPAVNQKAVAPEQVNDQSVGLLDRVIGGPPGGRENETGVRLLRSPSFYHSANDPVRAIAFIHAQQSYGNRFAQRALAGRVVQRRCSCGGTCEECRAEEEGSAISPAESPGESTRLIQRQPDTSSSVTGAESKARDLIPSSTGGLPIDAAARAKLEKYYATDLSDVRVHTDSEDARSAESIDAQAYTAGREVYFGPGMYAPSSAAGQKLLAHEVAHVIQQSAGKRPSIAAKTTLGVKIGAVDDPLEAEAERAAKEFASGTEHADPDDDVRKRHQSPIQRFVQRAPDEPKRELPPGTYSLQVGPWTFTTDQVQLHYELMKIVAERGLPGLEDALWYTRNVHNPGLCDPLVEQSEACKQWITSKYKVRDYMEVEVPNFRRWCEKELEYFEGKLRENLKKILAQNKKDTLAEMARYGITVTEEEIEVECMISEYGAYCPPNLTVTTYGMQTQSAESLGLADAAQILLDRANAINTKKNEQKSHLIRVCEGPHACWREPDESYASYGPIIQQMEADYTRIRKPLENKYPVLAPFADKMDNPEGLATLANKDPSNANAKAKLVGAKLKETLLNIKKVEDKGDDLNVWRLDKLVEVTKVTSGFKDHPARNGLVDWKFKDEKPGPLSSILLLALNILALVFAAPTGGLSLALAAGVNAAVAVVHIRDYLLEQALAGSGLGAAKSLSENEPSLFWLAVEVIGAAVDVGAAAAAVTKTFANLAKLAKVAEEAGKGTEEAADAVKALKEAATHEPNGKVLVEGIERHFQGASKEGEILEAFGGTKKEAELFEASTKAADEAAQATVPSAKTIAGGEVKATRAGLFSCHSPCTTIRGKFAQELAAREDLNKRLLDLEAELVAKQGDEAAMKSIAERAAKIEDELRQTVTFDSPLRSESNFGDLVKRRGSGAENLTSKPPDWTGANEAAFKYGKEVADLEKAGLKDGYYWRLDQEGNLSLIRKDAELPKMRFNPQEGKFVEVEDQVIRAKIEEGVVPKGTEEGVFSKTKLSSKERAEFDEIMKRRKELIEQRNKLQELDEAGKLTPAQEKELSSLRYQINLESEKLGNNAAKRYMESLGGKKPVFEGAPGQSGVFDQVWKITEKLPDGKTIERFYVVEAKGGSARLGTRQVTTATGAQVAAEQGTPQYFQSILANMPEGQLSTDLQLALKEGRVTYLKVQAPIGTKAGEAVLSDFKVAQFDITTK
jgi:hypothetical protein